MEVRDRWESKVVRMRVNECVEFLREIRRQEKETEDEIKKLEEKRQMHHRDAEFVTRAIREKIPSV